MLIVHRVIRSLLITLFTVMFIVHVLVILFIYVDE